MTTVGVTGFSRLVEKAQEYLPPQKMALVEDAYRCGINKIAEVISCGSDAPGTILSLCSEDFLKIYKDIDMVISKGQGNFEALSQEKRPIFFLFMAKCPVVAKDVGCNLGDVILLYHLARKKNNV